MSEQLDKLSDIPREEYQREGYLRLDETLTRRDLLCIMKAVDDTNKKLLSKDNLASRTANMSLNVLYMALNHYIKGTKEKGIGVDYEH